MRFPEHLKISNVLVLSGRSGPDHVNITLDAMSPFPGPDYPPHFSMETAQGLGADWCRTVLGIEPEVINLNGLGGVRL